MCHSRVVLAMGTLTISTSSGLAAGQMPAEEMPPIPVEDVERVVGRIRQELHALRAEHAAIARRIGLIKNTVAGLAEVFGPAVVGRDLRSMLFADATKRPRSRGLTDACRELLREAADPQTVKQITRQMLQRNPSLLKRHRYPGAGVQMMLRRLVRYGEAEEVAGTAGVRCWKSASSPAR